MENPFRQALDKCPVVAILRNLEPDKAVAVGEALIEAGISILEVPLNGRNALTSLELLAKNLHLKARIGAGTALSPQDVSKAFACGATFIFSPNTDSEVITAARRLGLSSIPGVATPSEALAAIKLGATALKVFPGEMFPPKIIKSMMAVLPLDVPILISGGIGSDNVGSYLAAGVNGFGVSSAIFNPDLEPEEVGRRARNLMAVVTAESR